LEQTINKTPNGIEKIIYYKYRKVLRFVRAKNIETNTIGYTPVAGAINVNIMNAIYRSNTLKELESAKIYELGFRNATRKIEHIKTKCQILLTKDGKPQPFGFAAFINTFVDTFLKDTYILSNNDIKKNLEQFIEINQIPKDYNGSGPEIRWYTDEPQLIDTDTN
jgi:hypothetical protein